MKYSLIIEFKEGKHCLQCPLRDDETDGCNMQINERDCYIIFNSWEEQMENCSLKEIK